MKQCPFCAEQILDEAIKCKHCGSMLTTNTNDRDSLQGVVTDKAKITMAIQWPMVAIGVVGGLLLAWGAIECDKHAAAWGWTAALALAAFIFFCGAVGRMLKCSYCGKENVVFIYGGSRKCDRCKVLHLIDWK